MSWALQRAWHDTEMKTSQARALYLPFSLFLPGSAIRRPLGPPSNTALRGKSGVWNGQLATSQPSRRGSLQKSRPTPAPTATAPKRVSMRAACPWPLPQGPNIGPQMLTPRGRSLWLGAKPMLGHGSRVVTACVRTADCPSVFLSLAEMQLGGEHDLC